MLQELIAQASDYQRICFYDLENLSSYHIKDSEFFGKPTTRLLLIDNTLETFSLDEVLIQELDLDYLITINPGPDALNQHRWPYIAKNFFFDTKLDCWTRA